MTKSNEFQGRCYIIGDEVFELQLFDGRLAPMELGIRGVDDYARDSLCEMTTGWFRDQFELPEGDHQVVFSGTITSGYSWTPYGDEYDEEIDLVKIESAAVPSNFAAYFLGEDDETSNRDQ